MRRALVAALSFASLVLAYALLLAMPEPLFAHRLEVRNVVFRSTAPIDPRVAAVVDEVDRKLSRSEIFDPSARFRVFIANDELLYAFLNGPYRGAIARHYEIGNPIFVPRLDVGRGLIVHFDGRSASAAKVLAHEAIHALMQRRLGLLRTMRLSWWKREGYAEYIGSDLGRNSEAPMIYREAMARIRCLVEVERRTFDEIMARDDEDLSCGSRL